MEKTISNNIIVWRENGISYLDMISGDEKLRYSFAKWWIADSIADILDGETTQGKIILWERQIVDDMWNTLNVEVDSKNFKLTQVWEDSKALEVVCGWNTMRQDSLNALTTLLNWFYE